MVTSCTEIDFDLEPCTWSAIGLNEFLDAYKKRLSKQQKAHLNLLAKHWPSLRLESLQTPSNKLGRMMATFIYGRGGVSGKVIFEF